MVGSRAQTQDPLHCERIQRYDSIQLGYMSMVWNFGEMDKLVKKASGFKVSWASHDTNALISIKARQVTTKVSHSNTKFDNFSLNCIGLPKNNYLKPRGGPLT